MWRAGIVAVLKRVRATISGVGDADGAYLFLTVDDHLQLGDFCERCSGRFAASERGFAFRRCFCDQQSAERVQVATENRQ